MRYSTKATSGLIAATLITLSFVEPDALSAQDQGVQPSLHQAFKACGKKWAKRARQLSPDQLTWMFRRNHSYFEVAANGHTILTLELLSTPSYRDCDVERQWLKKETTIRLSYTRADGRRQVQLVHFASDDTLFDRAPTFYPSIGKALLRGVTADGTASNRWLPLAPLEEMLLTQPVGAKPTFAVAQADAATAGELAGNGSAR